MPISKSVNTLLVSIGGAFVLFQLWCAWSVIRKYRLRNGDERLGAKVEDVATQSELDCTISAR